ncbi:MAG TPA: HSP90 family protein [Kineosporiaceae bacterium]|nr:HSP90 family protein [Kineosporiaceae bacterium]
MSDQRFRVDLRGLVDLLSHHLYSSPRVYVRELMQNAVDALTARRALDAGSPARVVLVPADVAADGRLHCLDTGVGLTPDEVERFLATIGSSSKRDDLGFARTDFLGQFGIGLLSCFLVSDEITVYSRSARGGGAVRWHGSSDGSYRMQPLDEAGAADVLAGLPLPGWPVDGAGTWVALRPRPGLQDWLGRAQVEALAAEYGRMLPWQVEVAVEVATGTGPGTGPTVPHGGPGESVAEPVAEPVTRRVSATSRPWDGAGGVAVAREELESLAGVRALAVLPVQVPQAGLVGAALVLDQPAVPTVRQSHRVYAKGMLVGAQLQGLLPDWAFFVRCVVDADNLRLTASREALYDDDLLEQVRVTLGDQVRRWMLRTAETNPELFRRFLERHALGVKAMAAVDDDLLRAVLPWLSFETTAGPLTLPEVAARFGIVRYAATVDEFRQVAPVAAAQGVGVVNGGYTYDAALIDRYALADPQVRVEVLLPGDLDAHVEAPPEEALRALRGFVQAARSVLDPLDVDVQLRAFDPVTLPALVLDDREARFRRSSRALAADTGSAWGQMLAAVDDGGSDRRVLLLNHRNEIVTRIAAIGDPALLRLAMEGLYAQALLAGQHPLQSADTAALNRSFLGLIERAVGA